MKNFEILKKFEETILDYGINILFAIFIIVIGFYIGKKLKKLTRKVLNKASVDVSLIGFISQLVYVLIIMFAGLAALEKAGMKTTSFVAALGAAGFAVGLALQGSLANFASGVLILVFKPFRVHDYIEGAGTSGTVNEIQIFSTILKTPDNKTIIVPNSKLTGDNIINYTLQDKRRIDFLFGISYDSDIKEAKFIIEKLFNDEQLILDDPKPIIGVENLGDSVINIAARPWVKTEDYWKVYYDLMEKVKYEFDNNNIEFSYPQRVIYHKKISKE